MWKNRWFHALEIIRRFQTNVSTINCLVALNILLKNKSNEGICDDFMHLISLRLANVNLQVTILRAVFIFAHTSDTTWSAAICCQQSHSFLYLLIVIYCSCDTNTHCETMLCRLHADKYNVSFLYCQVVNVYKNLSKGFSFGCFYWIWCMRSMICDVW